MARKLDSLSEEDQRKIQQYRAKHSLKETTEYIRKKYGIEVSFMSVKRFTDVSRNLITKKELQLLDRLYTSIDNVIDTYEGMILAAGNNKKLKLVLLNNYAKFLGDVFGKVKKENITITQQKVEEVKKDLDWQKEI